MTRPVVYPENRLRATLAAERPQERLEKLGPGALSDTELLAMLLRSGTRGMDVLSLAGRLIGEAGSLARLAQWQAADFRRQKGIGPVKALQLVTVMEVAKRIGLQQQGEAPLLNRTDLVADYLRVLSQGLAVEKFWVLSLNRKNRLVKCDEVTSGIATAALAHPREVFRLAIQTAATAIICAHNLCAAAHRLCYVVRRAMWSNRPVLLPLPLWSRV
ncbi:MAG: RadC family protein [Opitutales bacterium]